MFQLSTWRFTGLFTRLLRWLPELLHLTRAFGSFLERLSDLEPANQLRCAAGGSWKLGAAGGASKPTLHAELLLCPTGGKTYIGEVTLILLNCWILGGACKPDEIYDFYGFPWNHADDLLLIFVVTCPVWLYGCSKIWCYMFWHEVEMVYGIPASDWDSSKRSQHRYCDRFWEKLGYALWGTFQNPFNPIPI